MDRCDNTKQFSVFLIRFLCNDMNENKWVPGRYQRQSNSTKLLQLYKRSAVIWSVCMFGK